MSNIHEPQGGFLHRATGIKPHLLLLGMGFALALQMGAPLAATASGLPPQASRGPVVAKSGLGKKDCSLPMIEMVPTRYQARTKELTTGGYTSLEHPKIWVDLPYSTDELQELVLTVRDSTGEKYYEASVDKPAGEGLTSVTLPKAYGLKNQERYEWTLQAVLQCGLNSNGDPIEATSSASAWIERYDPSDARFLDQLKNSSALEKVSVYRSANYWYDAFDQMAELRRSDSGDTELKGGWNALLGDYGLCTLAGRPFAPLGNVAAVQAGLMKVSQLANDILSGCA